MMGYQIIWLPWSEMTPKNQTLEGKNWMLGGMGDQKSLKIVKNRRTSLMDDP